MNNCSLSLWNLPEVWLTLGAVILLLVEGGVLTARRVGWLSLLLLVICAALSSCAAGCGSATLWNDLYSWDPLARFFKVFFFAVTGLVIWLAMESDTETDPVRAEFYILPLFVAAGLGILSSARDLMVLFVGLELVTVSFYVLVYQRTSVASLEAGVKYLIMGALSSAFLVMGIAYVFGSAKSTHYAVIALAFSGQAPGTGLVFGLLLILAGLGFKIAAVPFHVWAPDVYEGAPTPVTAFLAIGSKAGGFILLLNALSFPFADASVAQIWIPVLGVLAALSLVLGNLAAIPQRSLKRLLAYSGIGHAGYLLIGVTSHTPLGRAAVIFYLVTYFLGAGTAFLVLVLARRKIPNDMIYSFAGLVQRSPLLAFSLSVALVSMAGIPPFAGFFGKFLIFTAAWDAKLYGLLALAAVSAVVGLYYYLGVIRYMFWSEPVDTDRIELPLVTRFVLLVLVFLTLALGFWAQPLIAAVQQSVF